MTNAVGSASSFEAATARQDAQYTLLKKVLENRQNAIATLVQDAVQPAVKAHGMVGTRINTHA